MHEEEKPRQLKIMSCVVRYYYSACILEICISQSLMLCKFMKVFLHIIMCQLVVCII